ncbi:histidine phosphatase family protein [Rheinheimera sp. 1928-s]|uniref:histidine phosphatase family protein n=1 Tax=Rheinheimera sp. 1928-s TaxID=3033803 RepID=UPI00262A454C|nr:histidine phosphatase family protein [Rheinheimera sp. 1928-s]MDF3126182.1 histidine phosphatase family protein [Rheinheimera sp. 1928-s]
MQQIDLVRHGPVAGPAALYGWTDVQLQQQSPACLDWLCAQSYQHILSSPLQRCLISAEAQAKRLQLKLSIEPDLKEMNFGLWDGVPFDEHSQHWPEQQLFWQQPFAITPPQGESLAAFQQRVFKAFELHSRYQQQQALWLVHGGVIRLLLASLLNIDLQQSRWLQQLSIAYGSVSRISRYNEQSPWHIHCIGSAGF